MRNPLRPPRRNASSRLWSLYANVVGASPLLTGDARVALLRRLGIEIGDNVSLGPACYFHSDLVSIGDRALVNHGCHFEAMAPIDIGTEAALGMYVRVITSTHEIGSHGRRQGEWHSRPVTIGAGAWVGAGALILPGVTIGAGSVVAAGAVVSEDCEPDALYAGAPARRVRDLERD